ncbi:MAG: segregation/condensation protein A [Candidatus Competibacteraceae bacterium]|nr:segregation/condensation protein A [Candidatus Competibacteraceae bacterium]
MSIPTATSSPPDSALARVQGKPLTSLPHDLYIPPDALEVFLEAFEGPLDLLLYLIKKQNLDVLDIPIAAITRQYMEYLSLMLELRLELAAEYLVMAAVLAEIKSRMLLPRPNPDDEQEEDPRAELVRRLQEYERFKHAGEQLDALPRLERDLHAASAAVSELQHERPQPEVTLTDLLGALQDILTRAEHFDHHHIQREQLSVRERMSQLLDQLNQHEFQLFTSLFQLHEGRAGVVVTFLAMLELIREALVELVQTEPFAPIYLRTTA